MEWFQEWVIARHHGSLQPWDIAEDYQIRDGVIVEVCDPLRYQMYYPFAYADLPGRLAELKEGNEAQALAFVRNWGRLGYTELFFSEPHHIIEILNKSGSNDASDKSTPDVVPSGDPVSWIQQHACTVAMLLDLIRLRRDGQAKGIQRHIDSLILEPTDPCSGSAGTGYRMERTQSPRLGEPGYLSPRDFGSLGYKDLPAEERRIRYAAGLKLISVGLRDVVTGSQPMVNAGEIVASVIDDNIRGLGVFVFDDGNGTVIESYRFPALLTAVYGQLLEASKGRRGYYQCAYRHCSRWWPYEEERRGPKRRYCQPEIDGT